MSAGWIALPGGSTRHLFPGLGTRALCGVERSVDQPGVHDTDLPICARCDQVIRRRRKEARGEQ